MFKSINIKLAIFFFLFLGISFSTYLLVTTSFNHEENYSHIINEAGKQRMLLERINKNAIQLVYLKDTSTKKDLISARNNFKSNLNNLLHNYDNNNHFWRKSTFDDYKEQLKKIESQWKFLSYDIDQLVTNNGSQEIVFERINKRIGEMLSNLEDLIDSFEKEGIKSYQGLTTDNTILILLNLLFVIVLFVIWRLLNLNSTSERKYRFLVDYSPIGIMMFQEQEVAFINQFALKVLGYSNEKDIVGKSIFTFIHPSNHELVSSRLKTVHENKKIAELIEEAWLRVDGEIINVEVLSIPFHIVGEKITLTIFRDITEQKRSKNDFEHIYKELINVKDALDKSSIVEITNNRGIIQYVNEKFCEVSKYQAAEVIGKSHQILKSGQHSQDFYKSLWSTLLKGEVWEGQIKNKAKDGSYYWVQTIIIPFINNNGELYQFLAIRNNITERKMVEKKIEMLATKDYLTQLYNRRTFEKKLKEEIEKEQRVAIIFLDLDRFKYINDSLGHSIGDELLKFVGKRLKEIVGTDGIVSRQGGDEFSILVKYIEKEHISNLAKKIITSLNKPYFIDDKELLITCSIGITLYPDHGKDIKTLMRNADIAMYWSKENGKNDFSVYQDQMNKNTTRIMKLELELRKAVENEEFLLWYQPQLDLYTKEVVGCEALIRWNHPKMGIIPPDEFIPLAEETGLIIQIGEWVLKEACKQNKKWHDMGYSEIQIAVNISVQQLKQSNFVATIKNILRDTQLDSRFLELEITESLSLLSEETQIMKLDTLKELGVSLAIDDFGSGYSSLKYLSKLPVDTLKIDKAFIDEIGKSNQFTSSLMTNAIISLAKSLNIEVVAEGIETKDQMNYLIKHQCDIGQGYFLSKPLPANKLEVFLERYSENKINSRNIRMIPFGK